MQVVCRVLHGVFPSLFSWVLPRMRTWMGWVGPEIPGDSLGVGLGWAPGGRAHPITPISFPLISVSHNIRYHTFQHKLIPQPYPIGVENMSDTVLGSHSFELEEVYRVKWSSSSPDLVAAGTWHAILPWPVKSTSRHNMIYHLLDRWLDYACVCVCVFFFSSYNFRRTWCRYIAFTPNPSLGSELRAFPGHPIQTRIPGHAH
jgi:hypothetical protein